MTAFLCNISARGIATLTLNRPDVHNAFDDVLIETLRKQLQQLDQNSDVRAVLLTANGRNFSAGADLHWMQRVAQYAFEKNQTDAMELALLMKTLHHLSKPTIALVQGGALGGGVGLVACCDIVIASSDAYFCLSEVTLGLVPAVISPYVIKAIGERAARRYCLTAEKISAAAAQSLGLVHILVDTAEALFPAALPLLDRLCKNSPSALHATKQLLAQISARPIDDDLLALTTHCIAERRLSPEGQEGMRAFFEKRPPNWIAS